MDKKISKENLGYLLVFLAGAVWGTGGLWTMQMSQMGASSLLTGFTSHFFALPFLAVIILFTRGVQGFKISRRGLFYTFLMGAMTKGIFKMAYDTAISTVGVSTSSVLLYTSPVFVAIMSIFIFKEKLYLNNYIALGMNLLGVFLMVTQGDISRLNANPIGLALGLASGFLHASNIILAKLAGDEEDPMANAFYMLLFSSLVQGIFARPWRPEAMSFLTNGDFLFWAILNGALTGALANFFYLKGVANVTDVSKVPVISSVEVIVANLLGVIILGEPMNLIGIIGIGLMLLSIYLMNKS